MNEPDGAFVTAGTTASGVCPALTVQTEAPIANVWCWAYSDGGVSGFVMNDQHVDATPPSISITSPIAAGYRPTETPQASWVASDAKSGVATETAKLDGVAAPGIRL